MSDILMDVLYIIITGCGMAVAKYIVDLVNKKINESQLNTELKEYEQLHKYIDNAQDVISKAVLTVSQTYVDSLKNAEKFTAEAQEEAKNKAVDIAKKMLSEESRNAIIILYNDLEVYLDASIESMVKQNKIE